MQIEASIQGCPVAVDEITVLVDNDVADPQCEFSQGPYLEPELDVSRAVALCSTMFFKSPDDAKACVEQNVVAEDIAGGCRPVLLEFDASNPAELPSKRSVCTPTHEVKVTATVKDCGRHNPPLVTEKSVFVLVDTVLPSDTCDFSKGPDLPPIINANLAVELCAGKYFATVNDAHECVEKYTEVEDAVDSCRDVTFSVDSTKMNCEFFVVVTARVEGDCSEELITTSPPIPVIVDNTAPVPSCSYGVGSSLPATGSSEMVDTDFRYSIEDNCGTAVAVSVETTSNEYEDFNSMKMVSYYKTPSPPNNKVGIFVATSACSSQSNGQCVKDPNLPDYRIYSTRVTATDKAGLTSSTACEVMILSSNNKKGKNTEANVGKLISSSTQSFLLEESSAAGYIPDNIGSFPVVTARSSSTHDVAPRDEIFSN